MKQLIYILLFIPFLLQAQDVKVSPVWFAPASGGGGGSPTNMLSNGTFDSGTGWGVSSAAWTIGSGVASYDNTGQSRLYQADGDMITSFTALTNYTLEFDCTAGGSGYWSYGNTDGDYIYEDYGFLVISSGNHYSVDFTTTDIAGQYSGFSIISYDDGTFSIDNVVVYER